MNRKLPTALPTRMPWPGTVVSMSDVEAGAIRVEAEAARTGGVDAEAVRVKADVEAGAT